MGGFTLLAVAQGGRLAHEAVLLMASLARAGPRRGHDVVLAEPLPGPLWPADPRIADPEIRAFLEGHGAGIRPFESRVFGAGYPHGNKIEALAVLDPGRPFLFLDTDTFVLRPLGGIDFRFHRPTASLRREDTWPKLRPGGPSRAAIWRALYDRFGIDYAASLDPARPETDWERHLYFNAGWFTGPCPARFGALFLAIARAIRDDPPPELAGQSLDPWLDQVALPLVVTALGGGRDPALAAVMDGVATCHWRTLPLLYARADAETLARFEAVALDPPVRALLDRHAPFRQMLAGGGRAVRALFPQGTAGMAEREIRQRIRAAGLWMR